MLRKLYINGTVISKFLAFLKLYKIVGIFASPNRYFTEKSRWVFLTRCLLRVARHPYIVGAYTRR